MSNFIVKQEGPSSVVADNLWEVRLGAVALVIGALAGALGMAAVLGRRSRSFGSGQKPRQPAGWSVNIAHRGGAKIGPENTLEGFREGLEAGAGVIELDVHATAEGELVVIHDPAVDRTTDGAGAVREMTLAELRRLDAGFRFTPDDGKTYPWRGKGVRIPTLEEVYRGFPDVPVNIEIKGERPGIEEKVWQTIDGAEAEERTLVVSDDSGTTRRFRQACGGKVATAASSAELFSFWLLSRLHLGNPLGLPFRAVQAPETYRGLRVVTPEFVRAVREQGLWVDVWTIDEEPDMRRLLGYGVDGIITDRPDVLTGILGESEAGTVPLSADVNRG